MINRITNHETADTFSDSTDGALMQPFEEMEAVHVNNIGKLEWFKRVFLYLPFHCLITIDRLLFERNCKQFIGISFHIFIRLYVNNLLARLDSQRIRIWMSILCQE